MPVFTAKGLERFTPASYEGAAGAPVYLLAKPTWFEKGVLVAELARFNLRNVPDKEMAEAIREAIVSFDLENGDDLLQVVAAFQDLIVAEPRESEPKQDDGETDEAFQERIAAYKLETERRQGILDAYNELGSLVRQSSSKVGNLMSTRVAYANMVDPIVVSVYLRGWENVSAKFRRLGDMVPPDLIEAVPPQDITAIAGKIVTMLRVSPAERGN